MNRLGLTIAFLFGVFFAYSDTIVWDGTKTNASIGKQVLLYSDDSRLLTVEEVSADTFSLFVPSEKDVINYSFTDDYQWIKFNLQNQTEQTLYLELRQAFLPFANLYYKNGNGEWEMIEGGYEKNMYERKIKHHHQIFELPEGVEEFYIHLLSYNNPIPIKIWEQEAFRQKVPLQKLSYGIYVGILLFVIVNHFFLFISIKNITYLHYVLLVTIYLMIILAVMEGFLLYVFPKANLMFWHSFFPPLAQPITITYAMTFVELKKYAPKMHKVALGFAIYFTLYFFIHAIFPLPVTLAINTLNAVLLFFVITVFTLVVARKGNKLSLYFSIVFIVWFIINLMEAIYNETGRPTYLLDFSHVAIAIFFEVVMLSYLLTLRFEWERKENEDARLEAQQKVIETTQENERIVKEQNMRLEQQVKLRTAQLEDANQDLSKALKTAELERKKSDQLLLNILPATTADELKEFGYAQPQNYNAVTVLFTDFKDFTKSTVAISPKELVSDLNYCFGQFDEIMQQYGIEKIKTIGDAYMAVGGLPIASADHAIRTVKAAKDILYFMQQWEEEKSKRQKESWKIRIGIHSGPVISGVVGKHKFSYDVWGDTVNTASRMETNGIPSTINISSTTYSLIKEEFHCTSRGAIDVKGKGKLEMYLVN